MSVVGRILGWFTMPGKEAPSPVAACDPFVYVKIPEDIEPMDRGDKYEDPIDAKLKALGLGEVSGGGSQLGEKRPDGSQGIEFCGIDVDATDLDGALALLREALPSLGVPRGTELHYARGETRLRDVFEGGTWTVGVPRTFLHPGFGT